MVDNVIPLRKKPTFFTPAQKSRIGKHVKGVVAVNPDLAVDLFDKALCEEAVAQGRVLGSRLGKFLGAALVSKLATFCP